MKENDSIVKTAGRGTVYITASKLYFIVTGYGIYFALPRILSPEQFGVYGVVTGIVSIINAVIVVGTQQAVSKFVSEDPRRADAVKLQALKLQCLIGGAITGAYFLAAPIIAQLMNDPHLVAPLRMSALITIAYTFYSVFMGHLNGQKKFLRQSALDMSYSTLKVLSIVGIAMLTGSVLGAVFGFGLAAVAALCIAPAVAGKAEDQIDDRPTAAAFIKFQMALLGFVLVNNLLQKVDLMMLKALGSSSSSAASEMAGYYTALTAVANITYQAIISVAFVIFPLVSNAVFEKRNEEVKTYIRQTVKYTLVIMALSATIFSSNAAPILGLLYREPYRAGAPALSVAAYGMLCFGLIYIFTTIISGSGRPRVSLTIGFGTLILSAVLNGFASPRYGLMGAAVATTIAMAAGAAAAGLYILRTFGACANPRSIVCITIAAAIAYQIALIFPSDAISNLILRFSMQAVVYVAILIWTGEIGRNEINQIRKIASI